MFYKSALNTSSDWAEQMVEAYRVLAQWAQNVLHTVIQESIQAQQGFDENTVKTLHYFWPLTVSHRDQSVRPNNTKCMIHLKK